MLVQQLGEKQTLNAELSLSEGSIFADTALPSNSMTLCLLHKTVSVRVVGQVNQEGDTALFT
jgi:hypothetical protein